MKMPFQTYYHNTFPSHLQEFYDSIPNDMRHHHSNDKKTFTIQVDEEVEEIEEEQTLNI